MTSKHAIHKTSIILAWFLVQLAVVAIPHGVVAMVSPQAAGSLDTTGAIQITDPFASCHADSYNLMADLGVKTNRKDISWSEIEPNTSTNGWYWTNWDNRIAGLKAKNMTAEPILDYGNLAVQNGTTHGNRIYTEHDIQAWLKYTNECVERYYTNDSHYTRYWELWNEPNLGDFDASSGFWTGTDEEYFALQKRTAANLSAQFPGIQLVSAGISGHDPTYLDAMFAAGAMENVDVLAFHPYSGANYETLNDKITEVKAVCSKYNFTGPVWITEVGMSTQFDPNATNFEDTYQQALELQATLVPKVFCQALANNISFVVWYCLGDFANWTWGEANFGLVFDPSNPYKPAPYRNDVYKPAGYAYKAIAHQLNWSKYMPRGVVNSIMPSASKLRTYYFLKTNGDIVFIAWNANGDAQQIEFTVPATGVQVFAAPSYKPGAATNYHVTNDSAGITVTASIDFTPTIFVLHMPAGASPVAIVIETQATFYDISLLVIIPALVAACVIVFIAKSKRRREAKL
jgi:hypothetical protein